MVVVGCALDAKSVTAQCLHVHCDAYIHVLPRGTSESLAGSLAWCHLERDRMNRLARGVGSDVYSSSALRLHKSFQPLGSIGSGAPVPCLAIRVGLPRIGSGVFGLEGIEHIHISVLHLAAVDALVHLRQRYVGRIVDLCRLAVQRHILGRAQLGMVLLTPCKVHLVVAMQAHILQVYRPWSLCEVLCATSHDVDIAVVEPRTAARGIERFAAVEREVAAVVGTFGQCIVGTFHVAALKHGIACTDKVTQI